MKLRRIAAAVMILSLGAASFTFTAVHGQMRDCRITERTIVGDAFAAAGLNASFGMGLRGKLYWKNAYTYDGAGTQETAFGRKNPFPDYRKKTVPSVRLTGYMTTSSTLDFLLTDPAEGDPTRQALLEQVRQEFFTTGAAERVQEIKQILPANGEQTQDLKLKDLFRYYPIEGDLTGTTIWAASLDNAVFASEDSAKLWQDLNRFLRIPIPETESSGFSVGKYPDGSLNFNYYPWKENQSLAEEHFDFHSIACSTQDAVYFTFDTHTDDGHVVDTSLIPGGYGIYRLPYDREEDAFRSDKLETVYPLDSQKEYTNLYASPDGAKLFLVSQKAVPAASGGKEIRVTAEIIDTSTMRCERREEIFRSADTALGYDAGDYLIFGDSWHQLCLYAYQNGSYEKQLMLTDVPHRRAAIRSLFYDSDYCRTAYDGERLSILYAADVDAEDSEETVYTWEAAGTVDVAVLNASGLAYYGTLQTNLQDFCNAAEYQMWKENVKPRDSEAKTYAHSPASTFTSYLDKAIWPAI